MTRTLKSQPLQSPPARQSQVWQSQVRQPQVLQSQVLRSQVLRSQAWQSVRGDWDAPLFWYLTAFLAGAACLFFVLFSLCEPTVIANAGVAAYVPPPATRLVPLPRVSDAPALAELPLDPSAAPNPASALTALAKAQPNEQPAKRDVRPARKRVRVDPGAYDQRRYGPPPQWNFGGGGPNPTHVWGGGPNPTHVWSGGPKSWF